MVRDGIIRLMEQQIIDIDPGALQGSAANPGWIAAGAVPVSFADPTSHAAMSGRYMLEQTFPLPADVQYDMASSPLALLTRLTGRTLI